MATYKIHIYGDTFHNLIEADGFRYQRIDRNCNVVEFFKWIDDVKQTIAVINLREAWIENV